MKYWLALSVVCVHLSLAQPCTSELHSVVPDDLQAPATGQDAAQLVQKTIEILEPALPRLAYLPEPFEHEDHPAAVYVAEHGLLPALWEPEALTFEVWQEMVIGLSAWYGLKPDIKPDLSRAGLVQTLEALIAEASKRVNPVALVASKAANRSELAFWGVVRNNSVYPRLIVYRPLQEGAGLKDGVKNALSLLSNCAYGVSNYIFASEETAKKLFLANNNGRMLIASTYPVRPEELSYVPMGEETQYLTFVAEELEPYAMYAALFEGSGISPFLATRLLARVRTNMNPKEVLDFVLGN